MQSKRLKNLRAFFALGADLNRDLPREIRSAAESGWDTESVEQIASEVRSYFRVAADLANWLTLLICAPLFVFILIQVLSQPNRIIIILFLFLAGAVGAVEIALLGTLVGTARSINELPVGIYRELTGPLWRSLDILFIAISVDLFAYVFPPWSISTTYPILILLALLWLFAPWAIYVARKDTAFIKLRIGQLAAVVIVALVCAASPIPMEHFQWGAQRRIVEKMRPFEQTEITNQWKTLQWFTQEGAPAVWYSNAPSGGYRLFSTPGTDGETGEKLQPVSDKTMKDRVVARFRDEEAARANKIEMEQKKREADSQAAARERFVREFVAAGIERGGGHRTALVVLNGEEQESSKLAARILKTFAASGVVTEAPVFTSAFVRSPLFEQMAGGSTPSDRQFHAEDYASHLIVIQASDNFGHDRPDGSTEMRTDELVWGIKVISASNGRLEFKNEIHARGIGFKDTDAQQLATERAEEQLRKLAPSIIPLL